MRDIRLGPARSGDRQSAFALRDLVTAALCIFLLVVVVLRLATIPRRVSHQSSCLSNIKAISTATRIYTEADPNGWALPVHPKQFQQDACNPSFIGAYEWGGKSGIGRVGWVPGPTTGRKAGMTSKYGTIAGFGPATRPLNAICYPDVVEDLAARDQESVDAIADTKLDFGIYRCPEDDGPPAGAHSQDWIKHPKRTSYDHFGTSYAANVFMVTCGGRGPSWNASCEGDEMKSNSPYLRPLSRVPSPSLTIAYEENIGRWAWACRRELGSSIGPGLDPGPTKALRGWHGENWTYNRAFVDGHAEHQKVYIEGTEDDAGYAEHYRSEPVIDDPTFQECYRYVIVRGPGWQKDTLPSPMIHTGLLWARKGRPAYEDCVKSPAPEVPAKADAGDTTGHESKSPVSVPCCR